MAGGTIVERVRDDVVKKTLEFMKQELLLSDRGRELIEKAREEILTAGYTLNGCVQPEDLNKNGVDSFVLEVLAEETGLTPRILKEEVGEQLDDLLFDCTLAYNAVLAEMMQRMTGRTITLGFRSEENRFFLFCPQKVTMLPLFPVKR